MADLTAPPAVVLDTVTYVYSNAAAAALDSISLCIRQGEWVCLVGDNGSGKTTLSRIIAGLSHPDSGKVSLLGTTVYNSGLADTGADAVDFDAYSAVKKKISIVFQNPQDQIVSSIVEDDVAFGPENLGVPSDIITQRVYGCLDTVGMGTEAGSDPMDLSGGQQQRITIASAMAMEPEILILDEPTAMIDPAGRQKLMAALRSAHRQGLTVIFITHNMEEASQADRIIALSHGSVQYDGPAENYCTPCPQDRTGGEIPVRTGRPPYRAQGADPCTADGDEEITDEALKPYGIPVTHIFTHNNIVSYGRHSIPRGTALPCKSASFSNGASDISNNPAPAVGLSHISYRYAGSSTDIINGLSLSIRKGEFVALCGENGTGKSTLAMLMCALEKPQSGSVAIDGMDAFARKNRIKVRSHIGYVMQHPENQLFADTVADDIAYGPACLGLPSDEADRRVDEMLKLVGIEHLRQRSPWDLSGGERRLAAIAGVLANKPDIIVLDEPTVGLDTHAREHILSILRKLHKEGATIVIITHSLHVAAGNAERVVLLHPGTGPGHSTDTDRGTTDTGTHTQQPQPSDTGQKTDPPPGTAARCTPQGSPLSRLDPRTLILCAMAVMVSYFAVSNGAMLLWSAVVTLSAAVLLRANIRDLWARLKGFIALFIVMGVLNALFTRTGQPLIRWGDFLITTAGVWTALIYSMRLILMVCIGALLLMAIPPMRMSDAFESLISPLKLFNVPTHDAAFTLTLGMRFMPVLSREFRHLRHAQAARGASIGYGSLRTQAKSLSSLVIPVLAAAIRHAHHLSDALDARCYTGTARRSTWHPMHFTARDITAAAITACMIAVLVLLRFVPGGIFQI